MSYRSPDGGERVALERTFQSAFGNGARYFARWGVASFAFWFALLALYAWGLADVLLHGSIPGESKRLQDLLVWPIGIGTGLTFIASAYEFLRRVYRVRKFLIERGGVQFANWPETVIAFGFPIANFFVPWNRLDVIRATLRSHRDTGKFAIASDPEKKLRTLGIVWGITSLVTIRGSVEDATWMTIVLVANIVLLGLSLWTFNMATRWLSELQTDFDAVVDAPSGLPSRLLGDSEQGSTQTMGPIRAVRYGLANLVNFSGRTRRAKFWPYVAFVIFLSFAGMGAVMLPEMSSSMERMQRFAEENPDQATVERGPGSYSITIDGYHPELMPDFSRLMSQIVVGFVAIIFLLAAAVARRLHDRGKSGAWGLAPIPFIVFASVATPILFNQFSEGGSPDLGLFFALFFNNVLYLVSLVYLIALLCGASAKGENRYGPEPAT